MIEALDAELGRGAGDDVAFHAGVQYRHIIVAPADWADAECTPPHDLSDQPVVWPTGPAAAQLQAVMDASRDDRRAASACDANQVWLWGQGFQPQMPRFADAHRLPRPALVTAVDLVRGLGVLTGIERGRGRRAPPAGSTPTTRASATPPSRTLDGGRRPVPHPRRGHRRGRPRRRPRREDRGPRGLGPRGSSPAWSRASTRIGPWRLLLLPDHPTPVRLKTHTTDPVPYLLVDSAADGPGGTYTEAATAGCAACPGHELMGRLVRT